MAVEKSMLSAADDFLIHQTPEVIRYVATSDRRFYDRHFLVGHANAGEAMFLAGLGAYPNLGVIDGFFTISLDERQITVRGSRELGADRMHTEGVGPFGLTVIEGLKSFRFTCAPTDGVSFDLTWTNTAPAFEEPAFFHRLAGRVVEEGRRFVQSGRWAGWIVVDDQRFEVTPETWWGSRDHSWGVRATGLEDDPPGLVDTLIKQGPAATLWIWAPMQFPRASIHLNLREAGAVRLLESVRWMPADGRDEIALYSDPSHALDYERAERRLRGGTLGFTDTDGRKRTIKLTGLRQAYLFAATGYSVGKSELGAVDDWRHGKYMGPAWSSVKRFDFREPGVRASVGSVVTHNLCRLELDTGEVGYADVELLVR